MKILVTGSAGFIGYHLCQSLLKDGIDVFGIDSLNDYYSPELKMSRLKNLKTKSNFSFEKCDLSDYESLEKIFKTVKPSKVINLAAQAGVRYSIENPHAYINSNITGFVNIAELCVKFNVEGLIYASSSSVYGGNTKIPFSIDDRVDKPLAIYGVTKRTNELIAYSYNQLYDLNTTGLRFFTVYGPWGRPDMALYIFTSKIINDEPIPVFNNGKMKRDFTYIDDIISGTRSAIDKNYKYEIFNLGNNKSEELLQMISIIEKKLNIKAKINFLPMQPGDVKETFADISKSNEKLNFSPKISIDVGISNFIDWYRSYHDK